MSRMNNSSSQIHRWCNLTLRERTEHRVVASRAPHVVAACPALPASLPRGPGGRKEARRAGGGAVGCVGRGGKMGEPRAFRFLPAPRPVTFYNHGRPPPATLPALLALRRLSHSAPALLGLACLSACRSRRPSPFLPAFNRSQLVFAVAPADAKALAFLSPSSSSRFFFSTGTTPAIGKQVGVRALDWGKGDGSDCQPAGWLACDHGLMHC